MYTPIEDVIDEEKNETTSLLPKQKEVDGPMVTVCNILGSVTTFMAMVPQGIFGALLTDKILLQLNKDFNGKNIPLLIVRIGIDGLMFITAEEGKRRLVRFFNTETFKDFGRVQWWKNNFLKPWSVYDVITFVINAGFTIVASGVFVGLAVISFNGIAGLLKNYQSPVTDKIAEWINSYYVTVPFMTATFISNLPFFPSVHKNAIGLLRNAGYYLIENPEFRHLKQTVIAKIQAAQLIWKHVNENKDEVGKRKFLNLYYAEHEGDLIQRLIQIGRMSDEKISKESWFEFFIKHVTAIGLTGLGIAGLYNFLDMTDKAAAIFHIQKAAPVLRWMDYTSMSAVAFCSIYNMALTFTGSVFFKRNNSINLISNLGYAWILISSVMVCLLGGAPNAYQSVLANEHLFMVIIAAIDSLLMETYGYYQLTKSKKITEISEDNEEVTEAYRIDAEIEETLTHVETNASAEEISQLSESQTVIPRDRSTYISIKNGISHCLFGKQKQTNANYSDYEDVLTLKGNEKEYGYFNIN